MFNLGMLTSRIGILVFAIGAVALITGWAAIERGRAKAAMLEVEALEGANKRLSVDVETLQSAYLDLGNTYALRDQELAAESSLRRQRDETIRGLRGGCIDARLPDDLCRLFECPD